MSDPGAGSDPLGPVAESFLARLRAGERPSPEEYARRHPELADRIRSLFPTLVEVERLAAAGDDLSGPPEADPPGPGPAPRQVGDYRILREVGSGGMGVVYEAVQESLGRHVALKLMAPRGGLRPTQLERFRLEARSAARLQHTNIVPVYGVGQHGALPYYVMQFIRGQGLDSVLDELRRLRGDDAIPAGSGADDASTLGIARSLLTGRTAADPAEGAAPADAPAPASEADAPASPELSGSDLSGASRLRYFRAVARLGAQVAEALAYAHEQGVLHRDIKPSNLLIDARGAAWVTDFGLAKVEEGQDLTESGDIVGTLRYMAPERLEGWSDPRSDVYGLGATLYELLTLRPAFPYASRAKLVERVAHQPPVPPRRIDPAVPRDLETIVLKAMAKEPAERYPSARAMAEDLARFLEDRTIRARRPRPAERAWRWCRRNPALAATTAAAAALLVVIALGASLTAAALRKERDEADRQRELARRERDKALVEHEAGRHFLYAAQMHLAYRAWGDAQIARVLELLDDPSYRPSRTGQADLRGWEWRYLRGLCHQDLATLRANAARVDEVAFSPDGRWLAAASWDGTIALWDLHHARRVRHLQWQPARSMLHGVAFSPDGRWLATASDYGTVEVWEAATGRPLRSITVVPSPRSDDRLIVRAVAFSPDGRRLAAAGWDRLIHLYGTDDWREILTFRGHTRPIMSVAFRPDGRTLASAGLDRTARLWDVATGREVRTLEGHARQVSCVAFSPDGATLATSSEDDTIRLWDPDAGVARRVLEGHSAWVYGVAFSPDGRTLASAGTEGMVKLWDAADGHELRTLRGHTHAVLSVAYSPDGRTLASADDRGAVKLWDLADGPREDRVLRGHQEPVVAVAFSPDGRSLASAGRDGTARLWDAADGREIRALRGHDGEVWGVAFHPEGRALASAGLDRTVRLWDTADGRARRVLRGHDKPVRCVAWSPDGRTLASGDSGGTIKVWDADGREVRSWRGHTDRVDRLAFRPDGRCLASSGADGAIGLWDPATGRPAATLRGHTNAVWGLAFHPDGKRLASAGVDGTVRLWDAVEGRPQRVFRGHGQAVFGVGFSPDGRRLASASNDRTVRLWDVEGGMEVMALKGHTSLVYDVAFSPDGRQLASGGGDRTILLRDADPVEGRAGPPPDP
jgi:eukaryotic-like serine/threonine-protein kinase